MKVSIEDIRRQYAELSDEGLLEIDREDLMDQARECYDDEVARRHLTPATPHHAAPLDREELAVVDTFGSLQNAEAVKGLLKSEGIRAYVGSEFPAEDGRTLTKAFGAMPVLVPVSELESAREILEAQAGELEHAAEIPALGHIRHGVGAVRPYLYGRLDLLAFVQQVFDAEVLERHEFSPTAVHLEVMIGDSVVVLEVSDPPEAGAAPASVYVYVADVDATYRRALEAGGVSVAEPADKPYDERSAGVKDSFGNTWWISTYLGS